MNFIRKISSLLGAEKIWVLMDQAVFSASSFFVTIFLARQLGIEGFGQYSSLVLALYLLVSISNALIIGPFQVQLVKEKNQQHYLGHVLILQFALCILMVAVVTIIYTLGVRKTGMLPINLPSALLMAAGFVMQDFFRKIFIAARKIKQAFAVDLVNALLQVGLLTIFSLAYQMDLVMAVGLSAIAYAGSFLLALYLYPKPKYDYQRFRFYLGLHMENGKWLLMTSILQWISNNLLFAAAGIVVSMKALGALRLAQSLFGVLNALLQILENYALPRASELYASGMDHMKKYLWQVSSRSLTLLLPILAITILFPKQIFQLCGGQEFIGYAYALQGMALLYLVIFLGYPFRMATRVMMMNRAFFMAYCVSATFSIVASGILIREYQLQGVIIALIVNQLLMIGYWHFMLSKKQFILWK